MRESNKSFWLKMTENFNHISLSNKSNSKKDKPVTSKLVKFSISLSPPSILSKLSKEELKKSKFHGEFNRSTQKLLFTNSGCSYTQALAESVKDILKLREKFLKLSDKKIENIKNTINGSNKPKPHINMIMKMLQT